MARFMNPGSLFMATLVPAEQKFLKTIMINAVKAGYTKFIEPCAGAFAMSHLAVQAGFKPSQIETSDVSMFTSIMGYAITGKPLNELCLRAKGFTDEELLDPATALYAWKYLSMAKNAGKDYFYSYLVDLEQRRDEHIRFLKEQLERAKTVLGGMSYRALDMWDHVNKVLDDPHALIVANPPTYIAGFEKYYDTCGNMTWKEPEYKIFDPESSLAEFMDLVKDAKCLVVCYEEKAPGKAEGDPVFARYWARNGINVYLTSNRPDEATVLAQGKKISRPDESDILSLNCTVLPLDYEITEASKIRVVKIDRANAQYYRKLWTYNITGAVTAKNFAVFIDDKIAGVLGIDTSALTMGAFGRYKSDEVFLMYGMSIRHNSYRLTRLITMLAQNKNFVFENCNDLEREKAKMLKTLQMAKYPESKEMRGIMKLSKREKSPKLGYKLVYVSELKDRTEQETLVEWLRRENKWQTARQKAQK